MCDPNTSREAAVNVPRSLRKTQTKPIFFGRILAFLLAKSGPELL